MRTPFRPYRRLNTQLLHVADIQTVNSEEDIAVVRGFVWHTLLCFGACFAPGQSFGQSFEVASIKPVPVTMTGRHVCAPESPTRYRCTGVTVPRMLRQAYGLKSYQFNGDDAFSEEYDVEAKVPEGSTPEQISLMLRNLLAERFNMASHFEKKEMSAYGLTVVPGKLKLKESTAVPPDAPRPRVPVSQLAKDADGFPIRPPDPKAMRIDRANGLGRIVGGAVSLRPIVDYLSQRFQMPVIDSTGLTGEYDYVVTFSLASVNEGRPIATAPGQAPAPEGGGPTIFAALERELGLKLEKTKAMIDMFVIDHVEKPSAN
jgi:uncharacterized protein (TIGR03435 family)